MLETVYAHELLPIVSVHGSSFLEAEGEDLEIPETSSAYTIKDTSSQNRCNVDNLTDREDDDDDLPSLRDILDGGWKRNPDFIDLTTEDDIDPNLSVPRFPAPVVGIGQMPGSPTLSSTIALPPLAPSTRPLSSSTSMENATPSVLQTPKERLFKNIPQWSAFQDRPLQTSVRKSGLHGWDAAGSIIDPVSGSDSDSGVDGVAMQRQVSLLHEDSDAAGKVCRVGPSTHPTITEDTTVGRSAFDDILHLLYIDGTSAGKCDKGTLDSQDILLLNSTQDRHGGMFGEIERGKSLCKLANEAWGGKVKGFIRMEAGFEIILCSFKNNLDFVSAARAGLIGPVGTDPDSDDHEFLSSMKWIKAVAARYDSIGGGRVKLDYENFVTCYAYDLDLFKDENSLPRLTNLSTASLDKIRHDVDSMVLHWKLPTRDSGAIDWQSVADMVIERYGKALQFLVSGALNTPDAFFQELSVLLQVFVDSDNRNMTAEMERCVRQFVPTTADVSASVAARAITSVTHDICSSLITAFDVKVAVAESVENLRQLMHYLGWSIWKKCGDCPLDEICFIPMWPFGAVEDFEHPQCRSAKNVNGRMGYWGQPAFGPPRKGYGYELPQTEVV
ncbi:SCY1-like protein [Fonsecaea monophora]|uniref:SCY1-like protein n=1 Tax=Fonsecaea monophora TaxID=254056 RepID=A0A177FCH5_9EURO|nr:SCY1-like protein [Fonsecaea monophora]OAG41486.1 SCY1-like protein [Fonsecaea monophora]